MKWTKWYNKPYKHTKYINIHYYPILHVCMNTRRRNVKYKKYWILIDSGCSSIFLIIRLRTKLETKKYYMMQWHTQAVNITTNLKVKIYFILPEFSVMKIVTWWYHIIGIKFKFSKKIIKGGASPFEGFTEPMIYLDIYKFKYFHLGKNSYLNYSLISILCSKY